MAILQQKRVKNEHTCDEQRKYLRWLLKVLSFFEGVKTSFQQTSITSNSSG